MYSLMVTILTLDRNRLFENRWNPVETSILLFSSLKPINDLVENKSFQLKNSKKIIIIISVIKILIQNSTSYFKNPRTSFNDKFNISFN